MSREERRRWAEESENLYSSFSGCPECGVRFQGILADLDYIEQLERVVEAADKFVRAKPGVSDRYADLNALRDALYALHREDP